jgi:hypothetical protein
MDDESEPKEKVALCFDDEFIVFDGEDDTREQQAGCGTSEAIATGQILTSA